MTAEHAPSAHDNPDVHHETSDANVRGILAFAAVMVVAGVFILLLVALLFSFFSHREAQKVAPEFPLAITEENRLPPEPRLQVNPREDLRSLRAGEDATLDTYGWVDQQNGVVRIPIEEAMKLLAERGLPVQQSAPSPPAGPTSSGDANSGREIGAIPK